MTGYLPFIQYCGKLLENNQKIAKGGLDVADEYVMRLMVETTAELVEKKSRFIATVRPVSCEEEAAAFIDEMKKKIL